MFNEAFKSPDWCDAMDREYSALRKLYNWTLVLQTADINVTLCKWVFRLKLLDFSSNKVLHEVRCCIREDYQQENIDFDSFLLFAPVSSHEGIRISFAFATAQQLIAEGGDVTIASFNRNFDYPVFIAQPNDFLGKEERPGYVEKLNKSKYGIKQAGRIWGLLMWIHYLCETLNRRLSAKVSYPSLMSGNL